MGFKQRMYLIKIIIILLILFIQTGAILSFPASNKNSNSQDNNNGTKNAVNKVVVEITDEKGILRTGPTEDFDRITLLPKGSRYYSIGRNGEWNKLYLSQSFSGWIKKFSLKESFIKKPSTPLLYGIKIKSKSLQETIIECNLSEKGGVIARQWLFPPVLFFELYNAKGHIFEINFDPKDQIVKHLSAIQTSSDTLTLKIDLASWFLTGYSWEFKDNNLLIKLRKGLLRNGTLEGVIIALDPGHGGNDTGAIGAGGYMEKDANLAISQLLRKKLEEAGGAVFMTRENDKELEGNTDDIKELASRVSFAKEKGAHLFLSIHCNAKAIISEGRVAKGSYMYYYHPASFTYATTLAKELTKGIGEDNFGVIFRSFHVTRENALMPSVLAEVAFISNPGEEEKLKDPVFQEQIANGLFNGIMRYIEDGSQKNK